MSIYLFIFVYLQSTLSSDTDCDSVPSTPTSGTSEDPLTAFEGHALQYAVNSIQNMLVIISGIVDK